MERNSPIVISGVGGSGTRLVAQMLIDLGFFMGRDVDEANDNLSFRLLFQRPSWFLAKTRKDSPRIAQGFDIFSRAMTSRYSPTARDLAFLSRATLEPRSVLGRRWRLRRAWRLTRPSPDCGPRGDCARHIGWGWKEPISHIYIEHLAAHFDGLRWIHVMRHGLDMAYSTNQRQLHQGGSVFDVDIPSSAALQPRASLEYWVTTNRRAIDFGTRLGESRFLPVDFDQLCATVEPEIARIVSFLDIAVDAAALARLHALPQAPPSTGRYRREDLSIHGAAEIEAVRELGFSVIE